MLTAIRQRFGARRLLMIAIVAVVASFGTVMVAHHSSDAPTAGLHDHGGVDGCSPGDLVCAITLGLVLIATLRPRRLDTVLPSLGAGARARSSLPPPRRRPARPPRLVELSRLQA